MKAKRIIACLVGITVLLFVTFLFVSAPPSAPPITARFIECVELGDGYRASFGITNRARGIYSVRPVRLEVRNGAAWELCADGIPSFAVMNTLAPRARGLQACLVKKMPPGSRLRLVLNVHREVKGVGSFFLRLQLRFRNGDKRFSLNPFNNNGLFLVDAGTIVSDEFVQPETKPHL
jgi:hypothetical protein